MGRLKQLLERFDHYQQGHRWIGFPIAVGKKFGDDQAGNLAALVAYYGFFSIFPLLLVFVSVLGMVLGNNPELRGQVLDTALAQFPGLGTDLRENIGALSSGGVAFVVGLLTALWAGMGVTQTFQHAMNEVWDVPMKDRPSFAKKRLRGLLLLGLLGAFAIAATGVTLVTSAEDTMPVVRALAMALVLALNLALFLVAFRLLTDHDVSWKDIVPGAVTAGVAWTVLQLVGGVLVTRQITNASQTYGTFATVIGLLFWIYLGAQMSLFCAEINVVRVKRLWPRSLLPPPLEEADKRVFAEAAEAEERVPQQDVRVTFRERDDSADAGQRAS